MILHINKRTALLYLTLFSAVFNDVLRINYTDISLFRILMIIAWVQCFIRKTNHLGKWILGFIVIMIINVGQTLFFVNLDIYEGGVTVSRVLSYIYFAFCIFSVIYFTLEIHEAEKDAFEERFIRFIKVCSYGVLFLFLYIAVTRHLLGKQINLFVSNVNNYGMYLDLTMPIFFDKLFKKRRRLSAALFIVLSLIGMFINDCKLNIFGAFLAFVLYLFIKRKDRKQSVLVKAIVIAILVSTNVLIYMFIAGRVDINGHRFMELIGDPLRRIFTGNVYSASMTSIQYRVNIILVGVPWLFKTYFIGIGFGNSNVLMRTVLGGYVLKEKLYETQSISLHNAPLELLLDFGIIALAFFVAGIRRTVKILKRPYLTNKQIIYCSMVLSLPVWILSPAGITTTYFLFIVLTCFTLLSRNNPANDSEENK